MDGFDGDALIQALMAVRNTKERFACLADGLAKIGFDIVNYGFFDPEAADLMNTDVQFMTTMSDGWMSYYADQNLSEIDPHVRRVVAKNVSPYHWCESTLRRVDDSDERKVSLESVEAGMRSAFLVPLTGPANPFSPVAGMALATNLPESEYRKVMSEHGVTLMTLAHLFHNASIGEVWRARAGVRRLSDRERDCLSFLAEGYRLDRIAESMGLARVTVELHLKQARLKLGAATLPQAVAKALLYQEIQLV